jgi:hypothetical protein
MKLTIRVLGLLALATFAATWAVACVTGLSLIAGVACGLVIAAVLAWLRATWLLQLAVCVGAVAVWHWPLVAAVLFAAPRLLLVLPGIVSSYLANRRHPRARWS